MWVINICISLTLGTITYQDLTSRSVYWYLFPLLACLGCYYHFNRSGSTTVTLLFIGLNLIIISSVLLCVWIYSRIKLKRKLEDTFGLGDILFFIAMALCLPTPSFKTQTPCPTRKTCIDQSGDRMYMGFVYGGESFSGLRV